MSKFAALFFLIPALMICEQQEMPACLQKTDAEKTVAMSVHQEFEVQLASNPTTGYRWSWIAADSAILQMKKREYRSESELVGGGGNERFLFAAVSPGKTDLILVYHRPWEKPLAPVDSFIVHIVVK